MSDQKPDIPAEVTELVARIIWSWFKVTSEPFDCRLEMFPESADIANHRALAETVLTSAVPKLHQAWQTAQQKEVLAFLRDETLTSDTCKYGPHRGPQGPNEDLEQCFHCGTVSHRMRQWGDTFGEHHTTCGLPIWHEGQCEQQRWPHPTSREIMGQWQAGQIRTLG